MKGSTRIEIRLREDLKNAEYQAWKSLASYKFQMFGYWAAIWVHLNKIGEFREPNPWSELTKMAKPKTSLAERKLSPNKRNN